MIQDFLLDFTIQSLCLQDQNFINHSYFLVLIFDKRSYRIELSKLQNIRCKTLVLSMTEIDLRKKLRNPVEINISKFDSTPICKCLVNFLELDSFTNIDGLDLIQSSTLTDSLGRIMGKITLSLLIQTDYCRNSGNRDKTCDNLDNPSTSSEVFHLYKTLCRENLKSPSLIVNQTFPDMCDSDSNFSCIKEDAQENYEKPWQQMYDQSMDKTCVQLFGSDFETYQNSISTGLIQEQTGCDDRSSTWKTFNVENSSNIDGNDDGKTLNIFFHLMCLMLSIFFKIVNVQNVIVIVVLNAVALKLKLRKVIIVKHSFPQTM